MLRPSARRKVELAGKSGTSQVSQLPEDDDSTTQKRFRLKNAVVIFSCATIISTLLLFSLLDWNYYFKNGQDRILGKSSSLFNNTDQHGKESSTVPHVRREESKPEKETEGTKMTVEHPKLGEHPKFIPPEFDVDGVTRIHVVFSTDCSHYQHWQSYALFHSAMEVCQPGRITRIASGCSPESTKKTLQWHIEHIQSMSDSFELHFTPSFTSVIVDGEKVGDSNYFNKPFGLKHWMENGKGMGVDPEAGNFVDENVVIILIDPDMLLLRPLGVDFSNKNETIFAVDDQEEWVTKVQHGKPFAQMYSLGARWRMYKLDDITGNSSLAKHVGQKDALDHYKAGPPYLATGKDMYAVVKKWVKFAPLVYKQDPGMLAEMYGYVVAAAHLNLPHELVKSLIVSDVMGSYEGEAWSFVDSLPAAQVCDLASNQSHEKYPIPNVIHYCQHYYAGKWFFTKYKMHDMQTDFFSCESPMMEMPPLSLGTVNFSWVFQDINNIEWRKISIDTHQAKGQAFMLCGIISRLNKAADFFKRMHCRGELPTTRHDKSLNMAHILGLTLAATRHDWRPFDT